MGLRESIEALKDRANAALAKELGEREHDAEGGESTEAPAIALCFSLETGAWQASVEYDGGMGTVALVAGRDCATPEAAVASLESELE